MKTKKDLIIPFSWEERRPVCLERFFYLPKQYDFHETWGKLNWKEIFGNENPVHIELCSGNGQWIGERAKENPNINWVAVELRFDRSRMVWLKSFRENIPNLYTVCGEGTTFLRHYVSKGSAARSFVNFPDPWPKARHAKNRIVQAPFLKELSMVLELGGVATFVTDDEAYRDQMVDELKKVAPWEPLTAAPHYHSEWQNSYGESYFATLWKERGRTIYYIQFQNGS